MRLVHYSSEIVTSVRGRRQANPLAHPENVSRSRSDKPNGFWLSDESRGAYGWRSWCKDNQFRSFAMRYEHEIELVPDARILYIRTAEELRKFTEKYGYSLITEICKGRGDPYVSHFVDSIKWWKLTRRYHGIIITPYIWEERLGDLQWYYSWDCASGCIWNPRAIASIRVVRERKVPKRPTLKQQRRAHKRTMDNMRKATEALAAASAKRTRGVAMAKVPEGATIAPGEAVIL
jgi:hypothetical protein